MDNESTVIGALPIRWRKSSIWSRNQIQPAPRIGTHIRTDFIKGMGKRDNQFVMILDIDRVFSARIWRRSVSPKAANRLLRRRCNQARGLQCGRHAVSEHEESISSQDFAGCAA